MAPGAAVAPEPPAQRCCLGSGARSRWVVISPGVDALGQGHQLLQPGIEGLLIGPQLRPKHQGTAEPLPHLIGI